MIPHLCSDPPTYAINHALGQGVLRSAEQKPGSSMISLGRCLPERRVGDTGRGGWRSQGVLFLLSLPEEPLSLRTQLIWAAQFLRDGGIQHSRRQEVPPHHRYRARIETKSSFHHYGRWDEWPHLSGVLCSARNLKSTIRTGLHWADRLCGGQVSSSLSRPLSHGMSEIRGWSNSTEDLIWAP